MIIITDIKTLYVKAELNDQKVNDFIELVAPEYIGGKITEEEINQMFIDNLGSMYDITILKNQQ